MKATYKAELTINIDTSKASDADRLSLQCDDEISENVLNLTPALTDMLKDEFETSVSSVEVKELQIEISKE